MISSSISREDILAACKKLEGLGHKEDRSIFRNNIPDLQVEFKLTKLQFFDTSYVSVSADPVIRFTNPVKVAARVILIKLYGRSPKDFYRRGYPYLTIPQS